MMVANESAQRMTVTFACPNCARTVRRDFSPSTERLECPECGNGVEVEAGAVDGDVVRKCLVCPSRDLFVRKDFPQRLGVALVAVGIIGSSIAWYHADLWWTFGILFATALADVLLFLFVGDALMCYRCEAQYRGVSDMESHGQFDLETHEKYRQLAARTQS